jgi:hypothetical protein
MITRTLLAAAVGVTFATSASSQLLFHEPFDYADDWLTTGTAGPQGASVLGAASDWNAFETPYNGDWWVHPEGSTTGINWDPTPIENMFDGTVANLATTGGFAGGPGPLDIDPNNDPNLDGEIFRNMNADIALASSVTNSFQTGTTTWISYVAVQAWDRNEETPNLVLATGPAPDGSRGDDFGGIGTGETGLGTGGGPTRNNRDDIYPMHYDAGQYVNLNGAVPNNAYNQAAFEVAEADSMDWEPFTESGDFGEVSIIVMKIQWNADTGGEDIQTVVRFDDDDTISEASFDALVAAKPNLSTANWSANKPDIDETQLDTLTFMGLKFFVDEIRIASSFDDALPAPGGPALPGDTDGDGDVDDADLGVAFANYTGPLAPNTGGKTAADGDVDGDGDVDDADLGAAFAAYTGPTAPAAVPEPTSLALIGIGGLALIRRRRA